MANTNAFTGVYECWRNMFEIEVEGEWVPIADMEQFSVTVDGEVVEWKPYDMQGWPRRLKTGNSITVSSTGKRNVGDVGNDAVAAFDVALGTGKACEKNFRIVAPTNDYIEMHNTVINAKQFGLGGATTEVSALEFEALSNGKPTFGKKTETDTGV